MNSRKDTKSKKNFCFMLNKGEAYGFALCGHWLVQCWLSQWVPERESSWIHQTCPVSSYSNWSQNHSHTETGKLQSQYVHIKTSILCSWEIYKELEHEKKSSFNFFFKFYVPNGGGVVVAGTGVVLEAFRGLAVAGLTVNEKKWMKLR